MRVVILLVAATLVAVGMLGCFSRSEGQLGHASFSYEECLFGCTVGDNALAAGGATAVINVQLSAGYTFAQVRSTNPQVATFGLTGGGVGGGIDVGVTSGAPGTTQLQLLDGAGKLVDQVAVTVAWTAKLAVTQGWTGSAPLVLADSSQSFHVVTVDSHGKTLIGTGSVGFDVAGSLRKSGWVVGGDIQGFAGAPGSGTVTARCPTATATLPVTVVPPSALTGVSATVQPNTVDGATTYAHVDTVATAANGVVYGAACAWTTSDPSVTVSQQASSTLESPAKSSTTFVLAKPGTFTASCAIGGVSTVAVLHR